MAGTHRSTCWTRVLLHTWHSDSWLLHFPETKLLSLSVSPVVVRGVGLVVLSVTVGRGAVLISVLTTGTRLELLLVSALALAGITEAPIQETVLLTRT